MRHAIGAEGGLPYVSATVTNGSASLSLNKVLLDTGSASTLFRADHLESIGLLPTPDSVIRSIRGVGGREFVVALMLDRLEVGPLRADRMEIQSGALDYGFDLDGILGFDFLTTTRAVIDLAALTLTKRRRR